MNTCMHSHLPPVTYMITKGINLLQMAGQLEDTTMLICLSTSVSDDNALFSHFSQPHIVLEHDISDSSALAHYPFTDDSKRC